MNTQISPGAIVTCCQTGIILYVVDRRADDGTCWCLRGKRVDRRGRSDVTERIAGAGDITVIRPIPTHSLLGV